MRAEAINALGNRKRAQRALPGARVRDPLRVPGSQTICWWTAMAHDLPGGFFRTVVGLHDDSTVAFAW